jgi:hypothetical protein
MPRRAAILENLLSPITPELMGGFSTGLFDRVQRPPYGAPTTWGARTKWGPGGGGDARE